MTWSRNREHDKQQDVWVFIEQEEGKIADVSLELLAKGQELAHTLNSQVCGLLCGYQVNELADQVIHHGADRVLLADHPELEDLSHAALRASG